MSLEDALKAKTLALISQQMANWVVEIQRFIGEHQANLVRSLDELQEMAARYDEKINEEEIGAAMAEVVAAQPPAAAPAGPNYANLRASLLEIEKGANLSEVLTYLVNEAGQYVDRAAMFIVKGQSAIGWYARGAQPPEVIKSINVPLNADTVFRLVHNSRHALRGHITQSPGTSQALARLAGDPQGILAVPLILREKLAAILYCDSYQEEIPAADADLIEILVSFAGKNIDLLSGAPKPATGTATTGSSTDRAAALRAAGEEARERAPVPRAAAPPPAPPAAEGEGTSTVMFSAQSFAAMKQQAAAPARPAAAPAPRPAGPAARPVSPDDQKAHEDAKRFARLVVSEIKLYNESKVNEGRRHKDIYERLKEDIERGRQMYSDRVATHVRESTNYFYEELVRILAGGDAAALGPM
ncbi:MAG TPA: hypothetical protein VN461_17510 [Vicinamibacteria bacterium]|jgi:hypothetical protein|nr:hypothetical protein [Vicinamibacteria bacterium]